MKKLYLCEIVEDREGTFNNEHNYYHGSKFCPYFLSVNFGC